MEAGRLEGGITGVKIERNGNERRAYRQAKTCSRKQGIVKEAIKPSKHLVCFSNKHGKFGDSTITSSSAWNADPSLYPKVDSKTIFAYTSFKKQGSKRQSRKARQMLFSRKIKTVKSMRTNGKVFVKAMIIKSYGQEITRPAVIMFVKDTPVKGHCTCPIGKCGICCHIIALLMFLEQYHKNKTRQN